MLHIARRALRVAEWLHSALEGAETKVRVALLVIGVGFGYLVLVNTGLPVVIAPIVGAIGAMTAHSLTARWRARQVQPELAVTAAVSA